VLSIGKLAHGQESYYLETVAAGAEEYYVGGGEAPGVWLGGSAVRLGLVGEVDGGALGTCWHTPTPPPAPRWLVGGRRRRWPASI
jgi:hypothetical protein